MAPPPTTKPAFDSDRKKTTFHSLPYELRELIWLATLTPRLIYLHPHKRHILTDYDPAVRCTPESRHRVLSVRFNHSVHIPGEIPATKFKAYSSFAIPDPNKIWEEGQKPSQEEQAKFMVMRPLKYENAKPPPALYVCSESREVAIRKGYVLAFKGSDRHLEGEDKEYWERNFLGDKGVWVDFERDMIMLDVSLEPDPHPRCESLRPLRLLKSYARRDTKRVKRLALGGHIGTALKAMKGKRIVTMSSAIDRQGWLRSLGLKSLEEVWVDDDFKGRILMRSPEEVEKRIVNDMKSGMSYHFTDQAALDVVLPKVKVVRGAQWDQYF
ncbi:hypothetical protein G7Y89_g2826 [Cudoniella acicularis]|uniref:2EXR domain-containing protein n=1 Tax=Cudoniella acicularis TaxID=354080 RepID=A0A8H4RUP2_9HELO|nr:hypothetical protein G7Y89_g2826 [Cudoniella acicularis]